jgi:hypothetical protein
MSHLMPPEQKEKFDASLKAGGWQGVWETLQPGQAFDAKRMSPVVSEKLKSGELDVKGKTCLVPGCGRGYDVVEFAKAGAAASIGLEIAPTAIERANEYKESLGLDVETAKKATVIDADFFTYKPPGGTADVGYDYTFLCALPPEQREDWARGWARLIATGGELVTMMFPVDPEKEGGPPYAVSPDLYTELLTPVGFTEISVEKVPEELSHPGREGKEFLGRWRKQ